jgi:hypothetical protein
LLALLDALEGDDVEAARGLRALATDFRWNEIMLLTEP